MQHWRVQFKFFGHVAAPQESNDRSGIGAALLSGFAALAAKLCARRQFRAASGTLGGRQGSAALLAEAHIARIGAAALAAGDCRAAVLRIAWVTPMAAMPGTAVMAVPVAAVVAAEFAACQITEYAFKESHDLLLQ
ncbi:hypothetical protein [Metallibacterium sp.]|jgi:hypothetical protein|uniref:hypothetical protein n=1 Tax=Metallibacterium sp. TaxID=2940281 RepID=UPI0026017DE3|nr:hypothetical protein [Metallibacterium sp.]